LKRFLRVFDDYGNVTESSFFDQQGEPATVFGMHRIVSVYFDTKGQPVVRNGISGRRKKFGKIERLDQN
jgi:hypothetical protein